MNILFVHPNFPGQFLHLAAAMGRHPAHKVVFLSAGGEGQMEGVLRGQYKKPPQTLSPHLYVRKQEEKLGEGLCVWNAARNLKQQGFEPHLVYAHPAWGSSLFLRDVFPRAVHVGYCEWFMQGKGQYMGAELEAALSEDAQCCLRSDQAAMMLGLLEMDAGISPFQWQKEQFPEEIRPKIQVLPDGVDTELYRPDSAARSRLQEHGLPLCAESELITYVSRGMEPLRGFPEFAKALAVVQQRRPHCHAILVGRMEPVYENRPFNPKDCLLHAGVDMKRVHFTGLLPRYLYRSVLQASDVHVYLTKPFVLSWSFLEALACGCAVVASDTAPVKEAVEDGKTAWLVPFSQPDVIAERILQCLKGELSVADVRRQARASVVERFSLKKALTAQHAFLQHLIKQATKG